MPRPKKPRFISSHPAINAFVPRDIPQTGESTLSIEGLEALRLSDFESLDQESAAKIMNVSRQTYGRILNEARSIVSGALVTGKALVIKGGTYKIHQGPRMRRRRGQR
ncbi:MAG: DUF134 domain-containing protein [Deltaproteobacteria bacterium]|nr:DUF134 domain-containing protein [Deltaproteobacteria bacterium]